MNVYLGSFDLQPGAGDALFAERLEAYLGELARRGNIVSYRLLRRKLGLGPAELGEFLVLIEVQDLAQLDAAFGQVAARTEPLEGLHHGVNSLVQRARFALYRDFPDAVRQRGHERF